MFFSGLLEFKTIRLMSHPKFNKSASEIMFFVIADAVWSIYRRHVLATLLKVFELQLLQKKQQRVFVGVLLKSLQQTPLRRSCMFIYNIFVLKHELARI